MFLNAYNLWSLFWSSFETDSNKNRADTSNGTVYALQNVTVLPDISTTIATEEEGYTGQLFILRLLTSTIFLSLSVTGVSGNLLVIYAILTDYGLQIRNQLSNMTVLSLAVTDFLSTGIVAFPAGLVVWFDQYPFGKYFCFIWAFCNLAFTIATIEGLMVISVERFIAVRWSLHYPQIVTHQRMLYAQAWIWLNAFGCSVSWATWDYGFVYDAAVCDYTWDGHGPHHPGAFWLGVWGGIHHLARPSITIGVCNFMIIYLSRDKGRTGKVQDGKGGGAKSEESKANAKILKAMMICILAFMILTFPYGVIRLKKIFDGFSGEAGKRKVPFVFTMATTMFQLTASCVNPLIYGLFRKDFKDAYIKIFKNVKSQLPWNK